MLEDVRRLKLAELNQKLEKLQHEYAAMFDEVNVINGQLWVLRYTKQQVDAYNAQKHHIWERFTKRREFLAHKANLQTLQDEPRQSVELNNRLAYAENQCLCKISQSKITLQIEEVENQIRVVREANSFEEMGLTSAQALRLLESKHIHGDLGKGDEELLQRYINYKEHLETLPVHEPVIAPKKKTTVCIGVSAKTQIHADQEI